MSGDETDYLTVEDLLEVAAGVIGEVTIRDAGLLAAAAGRPQLTVYGDDAYPTFDEKAAALLHSLVRNHALVDGNKRLAWAATRVFCILNGHDLTYRRCRRPRSTLEQWAPLRHPSFLELTFENR